MTETFRGDAHSFERKLVAKKKRHSLGAKQSVLPRNIKREGVRSTLCSIEKVKDFVDTTSKLEGRSIWSQDATSLMQNQLL